jgi:hypothetical protein
VGEGLSYSRQFFEIMSGLQRGFTPRQPADAVRQRHFAGSLIGSSADLALVPSDIVTQPAKYSSKAA